MSNVLDPDQDQQNGPDLGLNCLQKGDRRTIKVRLAGGGGGGGKELILCDTYSIAMPL